MRLTADAPYGTQYVSVNVIRDPQPVAPKTTVTASPNPAQVGQYPAFDVVVKNMVVAGDGPGPWQ